MICKKNGDSVRSWRYERDTPLHVYSMLFLCLLSRKLPRAVVRLLHIIILYANHATGVICNGIQSRWFGVGMTIDQTTSAIYWDICLPMTQALNGSFLARVGAM